jgi:UDP-N-acetyl-alpha-D-quinovosamine dehydrogenase
LARILVTGSGGFIGRALCPLLAAYGHRVIAGTRWAAAAFPESRVLGDIVPGRDWSGLLGGIDIIVHLAQRAHRRGTPRDFAGEPEAAAVLARAAAAAGAGRFLYLSSISAMGEATLPGRPFRAGDAPYPGDPYGIAKLATESALAQAAAATGLELVIVRPPLVYGPGVGGNFRRLLWLAGSGLPLPFATVDNRRSLVAIDNLVDLIATAATHPAASGQVLLAADAKAFSTPALLAILAEGQGRKSRLFGLPDRCLAALRRLPGVGRAVSRLTMSLEVDLGMTYSTLGWTPPVDAAAALVAAARALRQTGSRD